MKNSILMLFLMSLLVVSARSDITFSGKTWQTFGHPHRDHPEVASEFTVIDGATADAGRMRGIYGGGDAGDTAMYTAITVSAGDTVSFDWYLSNNSNNIPPYTSDAYYGDATFQFKTVVESGSWNLSTERFVTDNGSAHHNYNNGNAWYDNVADLNTGLHVEYIFGQTQYTLNISSLVDPSVSSTLTRNYVDSTEVDDIQCFRAGIWDSEQDITIAGFTHSAIAPQNGATLVGYDTDLVWTIKNRAPGASVNVYFGDPNLPRVIDNQAVGTYDPGTLLPDTKYYWRVDVREPNALDPENPDADLIHVGPTWSFTTSPESPQLVADPVSQTVSAGTAVQFSVTAMNAASYQWKKDGADLADGGTISGAATDTLTIADVQVSDEGFYTCTIDNELMQPATSGAAQLMTRRLVGHWKLDGDLTDSVADAVAGAPAHDGAGDDPNYAALGKDGGAKQFDGNVASVVTISGSEDYFNFYPQGYTVSAWVNMPSKSGSWGAFAAKQGADPSRGFVLTHNSNGQAVHTLRQSFNDLGSDTDVDNNDWHLVVGTYDGVTREGKVYVDGLLKNQAVNSGIPAVSEAPLIFGAERETGDSPFIGLLDDVRIWSYPLDEVAVALLYIDFNPSEELCPFYPKYDVAGPDGVGEEYRDCRVDLYDLLPMADKWLDCNLVPSCLQ